MTGRPSWETQNPAKRSMQHAEPSSSDISGRAMGGWRVREGQERGGIRLVPKTEWLHLWLIHYSQTVFHETSRLQSCFLLQLHYMFVDFRASATLDKSLQLQVSASIMHTPFSFGRSFHPIPSGVESLNSNRCAFSPCMMWFPSLEAWR